MKSEPNTSMPPPPPPPPPPSRLPDDRRVSLPEHELETGPSFGRERSPVHIAAATKDKIDWGLQALGIPQCWATYGVKGAGVRVAVLDTGIDRRHYDLTMVEGRDFTRSRYGTDDRQGHGTHCAGIIAAKENNIGVVGVAPQAALLTGKVLSDDGSGMISWIASGIDWAVSRKANVISMSLGGDGPISVLLRNAIDRAIAAGVIVVVAAGNTGPYENTVDAPGNYTPCVTVGATDSRNTIAEFSSRGAALDVVAPGVNVLSTVPGNRLATMSGTSMACPHVAGVAALYVEMMRKFRAKPTQSHFHDAIRRTALDLGVPGFDTSYGAGLIRPAAVLSLVKAQFARPGARVVQSSAAVGDDHNDADDDVDHVNFDHVDVDHNGEVIDPNDGVTEDIVDADAEVAAAFGNLAVVARPSRHHFRRPHHPPPPPPAPSPNPPPPPALETEAAAVAAPAASHFAAFGAHRKQTIEIRFADGRVVTETGVIGVKWVM